MPTKKSKTESVTEEKTDLKKTAPEKKPASKVKKKKEDDAGAVDADKTVKAKTTKKKTVKEDSSAEVKEKPKAKAKKTVKHEEEPAEIIKAEPKLKIVRVTPKKIEEPKIEQKKEEPKIEHKKEELKKEEPKTHEPKKEEAKKPVVEHKAQHVKKEEKPHVEKVAHKPEAPVKKHVVEHKEKPAEKAAHPVKETVVEPPKETIPEPQPQVKEQPKEVIPKKLIRINELTNVRELAEKMSQQPSDIIKKLLSMGTLVTINQRLDMSVMEILAHEFNCELKFVSIYEGESIDEEKDDKSNLKPRPPVVTIMGHVDHGKTSLLDAIRQTDVAAGEAGGITQHIGAYKVKTPKGDISFLDTPGHEAFTAMRSRGAQATDIVVLVVAADDGVMPQTVEAIDHARAAGVPIIVAINKTDIQGANPAQVKQELTKYNLISEEWGGDIIMVEVSAKNKINIDTLLEMILLKSEMMELKANPDTTARGVVIEAKLDNKRGPVATVLIKKGTLHIGDNFIVGTHYGKVRAMSDDRGVRLNDAPPVTPVEILGCNTLPHAGDQFIVVADERQAREIAGTRTGRVREESLKPTKHLSLEDIGSGDIKELRIVVKADVQGSMEAMRDSLEKLSTNEITLKIIHSGIGAINESDVTLAAASDAVIIGFNIRPDSQIERMAEKEGISIRIYRIIYEVIDDVKKAMEGLLEPQVKDVSIGRAVIKEVFKITKSGMIAGCTVTEGKVQRGCKVRLLRDNVIVYEGTLSSLKRFKDDVKEVEKGFECGLSFEKYSDMKANDIVECYIQEKIARKL